MKEFCIVIKCENRVELGTYLKQLYMNVQGNSTEEDIDELPIDYTLEINEHTTLSRAS